MPGYLWIVYIFVSSDFIGKAYQVDIKNPQAVEDAVNLAVKELNGRLDILVANSGIPWTQGPMVDAELDHYRNVVQTDLDGTFYCARAAAAHWRRQKEEGTDINGNKLQGFTYGSFVATASMSGHIVNFPQLQAAYNAAKAGVIHLCTLNKTQSPMLEIILINVEANPWQSNGSATPVPTQFLLVISQPRSLVSCPRTRKESGRIRSPWAVKANRTS